MREDRGDAPLDEVELLRCAVRGIEDGLVFAHVSVEVGHSAQVDELRLDALALLRGLRQQHVARLDVCMPQRRGSQRARDMLRDRLPCAVTCFVTAHGRGGRGGAVGRSRHSPNARLSCRNLQSEDLHLMRLCRIAAALGLQRVALLCVCVCVRATEEKPVRLRRAHRDALRRRRAWR
jgi:hypothetical protein